MYGWKPEYILNNFTIEEIAVFYHEGMRADLYRHGFDVSRDKEITPEERQKLREIYYTEKELRAFEKDK